MGSQASGCTTGEGLDDRQENSPADHKIEQRAEFAEGGRERLTALAQDCETITGLTVWLIPDPDEP